MGNVLTLAPPLNIETDDMERAMQILVDAISNADSTHRSSQDVDH